jgi:hypothetical protein
MLLADKVAGPMQPLLVTEATTGAKIGNAMAVPGALVHPSFSVCVTLYIPPTETVMEEVVAPVLHNKDPL